MKKTTYDYLRCNNAKAIYSIESLCVASFSDKQLAWATISFPESLEEAQETILLFAGTRDKGKLKQYEIVLDNEHHDAPKPTEDANKLIMVDPDNLVLHTGAVEK